MREDLVRVRSGLDQAQREVGLWFDRLVAGTISAVEFENGRRLPSERVDQLERELARLRSEPGDLSVAEFDIVIDDVEQSRAEAIRRLGLLSRELGGPARDPMTRAVVEGEIAGLDGMLARLRAQRGERIRFADRAVRMLARAVDDGVIDAHTRDRLRAYLE